MAKKEPVGSTANLPEDTQIAAAEEARETDIESIFGMSDDEEESTEVAASGGEATTSAAAGAAGAETVDGQPPAPALSDTPPVEGTVPDQTAATTDGTSSPPPGQEGAQAPQTPAPGAAPAAAAPVDPRDLKVNSLEAQVQALTQALSEARAGPAPGGQPQAGQGQQPQSSGAQSEELPRYALTLPPQVAAAINSGDEAQTVAGITHMMNSLATIVHHNVRLEMRQNLGQLLQFAQQQEAETAQTAQAAAGRDDYYKAFPSHKDPLILPIIQAESMAMAGEFPGLPWNDNYRNALGQRVEARLAQLRGQANGGTPPPAAPAASLPTGTRNEPPPGSELTGGELIADTFR